MKRKGSRKKVAVIGVLFGLAAMIMPMNVKQVKAAVVTDASVSVDNFTDLCKYVMKGSVEPEAYYSEVHITKDMEINELITVDCSALCVDEGVTLTVGAGGSIQTRSGSYPYNGKLDIMQDGSDEDTIGGKVIVKSGGMIQSETTLRIGKGAILEVQDGNVYTSAYAYGDYSPHQGLYNSGTIVLNHSEADFEVLSRYEHFYFYNDIDGKIDIQKGTFQLHSSYTSIYLDKVEEMCLNEGEILQEGEGLLVFEMDGSLGASSTDEYTHVPIVNTGIISVTGTGKGIGYTPENAFDYGRNCYTTSEAMPICFELDGGTDFVNRGTVDIKNTADCSTGLYMLNVIISPEVHTTINNYGTINVENTNGCGMAVESGEFLTNFTNETGGVINIQNSTASLGVKIGSNVAFSNKGAINIQNQMNESKVGCVGFIWNNTIVNDGTIVNNGSIGYARNNVLENGKYINKRSDITGNAITGTGSQVIKYTLTVRPYDYSSRSVFHFGTYSFEYPGDYTAAFIPLNTTFSTYASISDGTDTPAVTVVSPVSLDEYYSMLEGTSSKSAYIEYQAGAAVESVSLDTYTVNLQPGATYQLKVAVNPSGVIDKTFYCYSDDKRIATITDDGVITAVGEGTTTVYINSKADYTKSATCTVTVAKTAVTPTGKTYTVTFDSAGGSKVQKQTVAQKKTVAEPQKPTRKGYTFSGWYLNKTKYNFKTAVTKNITLTAKWAKVKAPGQPAIKNCTSSKSKTLKVALKSKVTKASGYEVLIAKNSKFTKSKQSVKISGVSTTISGLSKKTVYYVKVRAYTKDSAGNKVYGSYSKVVKIKVK